MPSNLSETTMDLARLEAELLAEEAKAAEQLKKKREALLRAREEECELHGKCLLISLEAATNFLVELDANARPEEDGDYVPNDAMDVEEDAATQGKGKEKEKPLVERFGAARCSTWVNTDSHCQVDLAVVEKWKGDVARGVKVTRTLAGAACAVCRQE